MKRPPFSDSTAAYYDRNANAFGQSTLTADLSHLYAEFLPLVRLGGNILDAGCGVGRDSVYFQSRGYCATAFDASAKLVRIATATIGRPVLLLRFQDLDFAEAFDGIWACASLLHVPTGEMDDVLVRLTQALRAGGPMYVSFKYGADEAERNGRFFNNYDEAKLAALLAGHPQLVPRKVWQTKDARPGRENERWLNAILTKS